MKHQALFSSKDESKNKKCRQLQFLFGAQRVIDGKFYSQKICSNEKYTTNNFHEVVVFLLAFIYTFIYTLNLRSYSSLRNGCKLGFRFSLAFLNVSVSFFFSKQEKDTNIILFLLHFI